MNNLPTTESGVHQQRENLHKLLGEMLINITSQVFADRELHIDGYRFINCIFLKCRLITQRGTFEIHNCRLIECTPQFNFEAQKSVQFYFSTSEKAKACNPVFIPKEHEDGTISIAKGTSL